MTAGHDERSSTLTAATTLVPPSLAAQFEVLSLLGRGGMGEVYLARERVLDRLVAIKVLRPHGLDDYDLRERFKREAQIAARLTHPNIVPLHAFGEEGGHAYFVMGYVRGETVGDRIRREGKLAPEQVRRILSELADALGYAHRQGVVHRDIKPDNILLDAEAGRAMLTDFGIAKAVRSGATLTQVGAIVGTVDYMSPEQCTGEREIDGRSDLYSLGVSAYQMLTGRVPFTASGAREVMLQHLSREPIPVADLAEDVPEDLALAITRCLAKEPEARWRDGSALAAAIAPAPVPTDSLTSRAWYDGLVFGRMIPFAYLFMMSFVFTADFRREPATTTATADAPAPAVPARGGNPVAGAIARAIILPPRAALRLALEATTPSHRVARAVLNDYTLVWIITGIASVAFGVPLLLAAFVTGRAWTRKRATDLLRRAFMQPWWWHSWFPRRTRHPAVASLWPRAPLGVKVHRAACDLVGIYLLCLYLPAVLYLAGSGWRDADIDLTVFPFGAYFADDVGRALLSDAYPVWTKANLWEPFYVVALLCVWGLALAVREKRRGLSLTEGIRLVNGKVFAPTFESLAYWNSPRVRTAIPPVSSPVAGSHSPREPQTVDELLRSIEDLVVALRPNFSDVSADALQAARAIGVNLQQLEREIARLAKDDDPGELDRVNRKLAVIEAGPVAATESEEMRRLLVAQRDLLLALRERHSAAVARRGRMMESLRTLWLQLALLRSQQASDALSATSITGQIREICLEVERQRSATEEVAALER